MYMTILKVKNKKRKLFEILYYLFSKHLAYALLYVHSLQVFFGITLFPAHKICSKKPEPHSILNTIRYIRDIASRWIIVLSKQVNEHTLRLDRIHMHHDYIHLLIK